MHRRLLNPGPACAALAIALVVAVAAACQVDPEPLAQNQNTQATSEPITSVFSGPDTTALPPDAEEVPPGDVGFADIDTGPAQAVLATTNIACESGFMRLDTSEGTFLIGIIPSANWDCNKALQQWNAVSRPGAKIGIRHSVEPAPESVLLVNSVGGSLTMRIKGLWRVPGSDAAIPSAQPG